MSRPVTHQAASLLLGYPDESWPGRLSAVRTALEPVPGPDIALLLRFCARVQETPPLALGAQYIATFDRSRRRCLYLTYYTDGDTRRRGAALAGLKALYREHGWQPPGDELPDHLPLMLEFAARTPQAGTKLLAGHRPALELLRLALASYRSPYADIVEAVCHTLPGPGPADRRAALRLARSGPPAEAVGLLPFPRRAADSPHVEETSR
ncbi:nitrate reductase molybdenum cofactor assembly chaperone [Streptomyces sp. MST-110588]|uniref:nitrate reductase molybdenum cofactor assembly chaperone n=1 Tax=Streptomyces sp. MST-110588 TaxID=2833628 RepID=UPI001F5DDDCC|nr:nitrate reductase molybdenum cofactor assembly chaperone [Streptomyces sp. MST-110588]UNO38565.1 nitrate reductase molybdenum cofactor assembly chaperone [Streptomyces sp. MST-110588]